MFDRQIVVFACMNHTTKVLIEEANSLSFTLKNLSYNQYHFLAENNTLPADI